MPSVRNVFATRNFARTQTNLSPVPIEGADVRHPLEERTIRVLGLMAGGIGCRCEKPDRELLLNNFHEVRRDAIEMAAKLVDDEACTWSKGEPVQHDLRRLAAAIRQLMEEIT